MTLLPLRIQTASYQATAIHLVFSLLLLAALAVLTFKIWYPTPLSTATGVFAIFAIICVVTLLSGPLLTLIVYKKHKKSLVFDMTVIVIIQFAALFYGVFSLSQARPVWLAFYNNRFEIVRLNDIEKLYLTDAKIKYKTFSLTGPKWVAAKAVGSKEEIEDLEFGNALGAKIAHQPAFYYPIEQAYPAIQAQSYELSKLKNANNEIDINRYIIANPQVSAWLPLWGQVKHMVVFLDKDGKPLSIVDLRPWTEGQLNNVKTSVFSTTV